MEGPDPGITVRPVRADEWQLLRDVRLGALADTPEAFGSTLEREAAFEPAAWQERAAKGSGTGSTVNLVAERDGSPLGMVTVAPDRDEPGCGHVFGMWVDPGARGGGIGRRLMLAADEWARGRGWRELSLWVVETNAAAIALYRGLGYVDTGRRDVMRRDETLVLAEFRKGVAGGQDRVRRPGGGDRP